MDNKLILTRGIPGSGKTTWAKAWVAEDERWRVRVNRDDLRMSTYGRYSGLERHQEETLSNIQHAMVEAALSAKMQVVVDDTNLTAKFVKQWMRLAAKHGAEVEFKDFNIDLDTALRRNKLRASTGGRDVPEAVIRSFYDRFVRKGKLAPAPELDSSAEFVMEPYVPNEYRRHAYIVDIDGTLADMGPCGRGPFEWDRVGEDSPIETVVEMVRDLYEAGNDIVFMSGRDEVCREATLDWLYEHVGIGDWDDQHWDLFMRWTTPKGEQDPKDSFVKYTLFNKYVRDEYYVVAVIDDRQQVVDMWRSLGLTVAQVAEGNF